MTGHAIQTATQLAAHLRSLRKNRGLTQTQLGEILGVKQTRIAKIERDPGAVSFDQLLQLATALDVQVILQPRDASPRTQAVRKSKAAW